MKNLQNYIDRKNVLQRMFNDPEIVFPLDQQQAYDIASALDCELSPENLHCDGEISNAEADRKYRYLAAVYSDLDNYCKRNQLVTPTVEELY